MGDAVICPRLPAAFCRVPVTAGLTVAGKAAAVEILPRARDGREKRMLRGYDKAAGIRSGPVPDVGGYGCRPAGMPGRWPCFSFFRVPGGIPGPNITAPRN